MTLAPEDVRYLRHWQVSIQCLLRDPDLDFVRCLRIISESIVPQLVPAINLEEHSKRESSARVTSSPARSGLGTSRP
jgi:hypothetical protein